MLPALETTDEINLVAAIAIRRSIIASAVTGCLSITNRTYQSNPAAAKPAHQEALYCRLHHHGRGWFGSNHKRSTYGSAAAVGRNISLEATDGFIKSCPAVTVTSDKDEADYILRPNKGSSTLYKKTAT